MDNAPSTSLLELGKLIQRDQSIHTPIAFAIYKILNESNIADGDIQNIGAMLTEIASGE